VFLPHIYPQPTVVLNIIKQDGMYQRCTIAQAALTRRWHGIDAFSAKYLEHMRLVARASNEAIMDGISVEDQLLLNNLLSRMKNNLLTQVALEPGNPADAAARAALSTEEGDRPARARSRSRTDSTAEASGP
jgi:hypothetical protein